MRRLSLTLLVLVHCGASAAFGQSSSRYFPVDHRTPGVAAYWNTAVDPNRCCKMQVTEFLLPAGGEIALLQPGAESALPAPAQGELQVGCTYRARIRGMADFPGIELYPTIELLDHLHAPSGKEREFPVPIEFTAADIEAALQNRLVTKVIYLEQPDLAFPEAQKGGPRTTDYSPRANLMQAADELGRPIAIVRLGGRVPDLANPEPGFYGDGPAAVLSPTPAESPTSSKPSTRRPDDLAVVPTSPRRESPYYDTEEAGQPAANDTPAAASSTARPFPASITR
jgi:hypothetical protein